MMLEDHVGQLRTGDILTIGDKGDRYQVQFAYAKGGIRIMKLVSVPDADRAKLHNLQAAQDKRARKAQRAR